MKCVILIIFSLFLVSVSGKVASNNPNRNGDEESDTESQLGAEIDGAKLKKCGLTAVQDYFSCMTPENLKDGTKQRNSRSIQPNSEESIKFIKEHLFDNLKDIDTNAKMPAEDMPLKDSADSYQHRVAYERYWSSAENSHETQSDMDAWIDYIISLDGEEMLRAFNKFVSDNSDGTKNRERLALKNDFKASLEKLLHSSLTKQRVPRDLEYTENSGEFNFGYFNCIKDSIEGFYGCVCDSDELLDVSLEYERMEKEDTFRVRALKGIFGFYSSSESGCSSSSSSEESLP